MITFPNCKINLGLFVTHKRDDGFHHLESIFLPVPYFDALEILPNVTGECRLYTYNSAESITDIEHSCFQAWKLLNTALKIPGVDIHLIKHIPSGAGLGGGSSDAAYTLMMLNDLFNLKLTQEQLIGYCSKLGSDQAFYILNQPCYLSGRGPEIEPFDFALDFKILLSFPNVHISTKEAYSQLTPQPMQFDLRNLSQIPKSEWKNCLRNDFQKGAVTLHPIIQTHINQMYNQGAFYAAMSGSGSAVFGLFD